MREDISGFADARVLGRVEKVLAAGDGFFADVRVALRDGAEARIRIHVLGRPAPEGCEGALALAWGELRGGGEVSVPRDWGEFRLMSARPAPGPGEAQAETAPREREDPGPPPPKFRPTPIAAPAPSPLRLARDEAEFTGVPMREEDVRDPGEDEASPGDMAPAAAPAAPPAILTAGERRVQPAPAQGTAPVMRRPSFMERKTTPRPAPAAAPAPAVRPQAQAPEPPRVAPPAPSSGPAPAFLSSRLERFRRPPDAWDRKAKALAESGADED